MNFPAKAALAMALLLGAGLFTAPAAQAGMILTYYLSDQGGPACQLSVPTTASEVRPRAAGMRNEGSTNAFVICQFSSPVGSAFNTAGLHLVSTDNKNHTTQCTAMAGEVTGEPKYSTKTYTISSDPTAYTDFMWFPADFNSSVGTLGSYYFSVTCNLPPGTSIITLNASYDLDVGA